MTAIPESVDLARLAAMAAAEKSGTDIVGLDVSEHLAVTDIFLVVSAANERQVGAVVEAIEEAAAKAGSKVARREGERENRWVLLDLVDVVVHVQRQEERELYSLERLWKDCPRVDLQLPAEPQDAGAAAADGLDSGQ